MHTLILITRALKVVQLKSALILHRVQRDAVRDLSSSPPTLTGILLHNSSLHTMIFMNFPKHLMNRNVFPTMSAGIFEL